ncbi:hypothetical protein [Burkholderia ambifaria]|nr:hypothetical protein [Burkholderia ambifaria]
MSYEDAVYGQLVDAFSSASSVPNPYAASGMLFAGPGAPSPIRDLGVGPAMRITPNGAWIDAGAGAAATGVAYGSRYDGALSAWSSSSLGFGGEVDLNAAAFRSAMNDSSVSSWGALTQQADARIATGTYDRFSDLGHAIVDGGSFGQRVEQFAHALTYTRPDAAEQIAAFRASPNMTAATFDAMLGSPLAGAAGGLMYASGRSGRDAYFAATIAGSAEGIAAGAAGFYARSAPQLSVAATIRRIGVPESPSLTSVPINGATRTVPLGFMSERRFVAAAQELQNALVKSGITDATIGVRGSSVTGYSLTKGTPFGPRSDIDFFVESRQLTDGYRASRNIPGFVHPNKILPDYPLLQDWAARWTSTLGRDVTPGAFVPGTLPSQPSIVVRPLGFTGG